MKDIYSGDYGELKVYYDEVLNKDTSLVRTSNDEPTPISCVEEMMDVVEEKFWKNPDLKILDPCCGCGNFFLVIFHKLLQFHTREHIIGEMLFFNDINEDRLEIVRGVFGEDANISMEDFLMYSEDKKYDMIVANPPYAKLLDDGRRASKNHNLIGGFISKSLSILNDDGLLVYITPDNWMSFADRNKLISILTQKQILHLNIHTAKKYFKKIGSSFTWYVIQNRPSYKDIQVKGIWKGNEYRDSVPSMERRFIPLFYNRTIQSILAKTVDNADIPKFAIETSSDLHKYTKKNLISTEQTTEYRYKLIHTPSQTVWANRPHKFQEGFKVFICTTSTYRIFIDNCGMTQSIAFIRCESKRQAERIKKVLEHPLYVFINNICRWGNFNNIRILQSFPYCEKVEEVSTRFRITEDEKSYII